MSIKRLSDDPGRMFHASGHVLGVRVTEDHPMGVRAVYVIAAQGELEFRSGKHGPRSDSRAHTTDPDAGAGTTKSTTTTAEADAARTAALATELTIEHATGDGTVWLGYQGGDVTIFELDDDSVTVLAQEEFLAHDASLSASLKKAVPKELVAVLSPVGWVITGSGLFATATSGEVITVDVTDDTPAIVESGSILAFTAGVELAGADAFKRRVAAKGIKELLGAVSVNMPRERVWLQASGSGTLMLRSKD